MKRKYRPFPSVNMVKHCGLEKAHEEITVGGRFAKGHFGLGLMCLGRFGQVYFTRQDVLTSLKHGTLTQTNINIWRYIVIYLLSSNQPHLGLRRCICKHYMRYPQAITWYMHVLGVSPFNMLLLYYITSLDNNSL